MVEGQSTMAGRRRSGRTSGAKSEALQRLKALRNCKTRQSYAIKMDAPIYDTVDDEEYEALVSKRRKEFSDFIVSDAGDAYIDNGEEEDWTKARMPFSSDEEVEGEGGEKAEKSKQRKKEKSDKEKKPSAASLMGNQLLSLMLVSKKRNEDKTRALTSFESPADDVIVEFAPDDEDRERWKRRQSNKLGLASGSALGSINRVQIEKSKPVAGELCKNIEADDCALAPSVEVVDDKGGLLEDDNLVDLSSYDGSKRSKGGDVKEEKPVNAIEVKAETDLSKDGGDKVFVFNAKVKEQELITFSAVDEWKAINGVGVGNGDGGKPVESSTVLESKVYSDFVVDADGSLPFYILDAYEEPYKDGTLYLFGKVRAGNAYHSCCAVVNNMQRCVYAIPNRSVFDNEVVSKLQKDVTDKKISASEFRAKLHEVASGLKTEIAKHLMDLNVTTFSMAPVKRSYAFERLDIPHGENYVLKINYSFKHSPLSSDLKGDNFCAVLGTHSSALELFLVKRKIKGPSWLSISKFSSCPSNQLVSWCKFEITVDNAKDIQVATPTKNTSEIPPVVVSAVNVKTIFNEKQNINEIVSASIISCSKAKIETPMLASEWNRPGVLNHYTVVRKLGVYPVRFVAEATEKNIKAGSTVLAYTSHERDLLNCLLIEIGRLDSDVLVGHNISGFDLDVLLHRVQACNLRWKIWSKIGRLRRSKMPNLTKRSNAFGSGANPGMMSCIAGRLLCDTYLCSRDLLKEVSYSLTQLAKTQLNKNRKELAPEDIPRMYQTTESLMDLIECNETDAWLSMGLMFHLSILPLTRQLTNISGNLWGKTLQGGRAQRVEYLLLHAFHAKKYIVPDKYFSRGKENKLTKRKVDNGDEVGLGSLNNENKAPQEDHCKGKKGPDYVGGLVLEPKRGLYDKYVLLLDFNSLYPSIIQEYNICFTTVERYPDGSVPRIPSSKKTGVLPELLKNLVERRRMVKSWLKTASGLKAQQFDIQQQALKLTANSMYGCLGFSNSRFYAKPLAELITLQGREILQSTVYLVQNTLNLEVIYGDTDSIMIYSGLDDIAKVKAIAGKVIQEVNKKYRCLEIDLDGLYKRMLLLKKKKYAAVKLQFRDGKPYEVIERKGLDMVRRDWSLLSKEVGDFCLSQILSGGSCDDVVESIHNSLMKAQEEMRKGEVPLEKYIITKSLTKPLEAYPDAKNQPHVQVALRMKQNGYATGCSSGDTVPYIICCEQGASLGTSSGIVQRARHPDELNKDNSKWMIDIEYYLSQQIHPVVARLCASIQGTDPARLADCLGIDSSKFQCKNNHITSNDPSTSMLCSLDDEHRYEGCQPLTLSCPSCSNTFNCPSIFSSLCKSIAEKPNEAQPQESTSDIWHKLHCPRCPGEGDVGRFCPALIANQVMRQAHGFISTYYKGLMTCDDETCKHTSRSLNLRVIGDSERGTLCPNYPRCNGRLVRKYSEVDLYKQLTYFCHILDATRCLEKVDAAVRLPLEKELISVRSVVGLAADAAQKLRDRCAYGWVQLNDLFVTF